MKIKITLSKIFVIIISLGIFVPILSGGIQFDYQDSIGLNPNEIDYGDYNKNPIGGDLTTEDNNPPTLLSPSNGAYVTDTTPFLDWSDVTGANLYNLQVARDSGFTSIVLDIETTASGYNCPTLGQGTHYWRVRTRHQIIFHFWGSFGSAFSFYVDSIPPPTVVKISPSSGTQTPDNTPTLSWNPSPGATQYNIQIDETASFSSPYRNGYMSVTSYTTSHPDNLYYWRVRARDAAGNWNSWSSTWTYRVDTVPPGATALISPSDNTITNDNTPYLDWAAASGASSYYLYVAYDAGFTSMRLSLSTGATGYTCPVLADDTYYWRVRARDAAGNLGAYSATWDFRVDTVPPATPTLNSPASGTITNDNTPQMDWSAVSGATLYELQVAYDAGFTSLRHTVTTIVSIYTCPTLVDDTYYWRVRARDAANNWGSYSSVWDFTVDTVAPGITSLTSPVDDTLTNDNNVHFAWSITSGATWYEFQLAYDAGFTSLAHEVTTTMIGTTCSALADNTYFWRVRARDAAGNWGSYSTVWDFEVDTEAPISTVLVTPADGAILSDSTPSLLWGIVSDGHMYQVQVDDDPGFGSYYEHDTANNYYTFTTLADDLYYWRVRVQDEAGNWGAWTAAQTFIIDTTAPVITDVTHTPTTIDDTDTVTILCNVTDLIGIGQVQLHYRVNGGIWAAVSMSEFSGGEFEYVLGTFAYNDFVEYYITADDTASSPNTGTNDNGGMYYNFTVISSDNDGPAIDYLGYVPGSPTELDTITIRCNVSDPNGINDVILSYRIDGGAWINTSMVLDTGITYTLDIGPFGYGEFIEFFITAIDDYVTHNEAVEDNTGLFYSFTVGFSDVTGPTIEDIEHTPITPTDAQTVEVTCSVTDASGIEFVTLYYRINGGEWIAENMTLDTGSTYTYTIGSFDYADSIEYYIFAMDATPNENTATDDNTGSYYSFTIDSSDVTGPTIDDIVHTANNTVLDIVNITCTVTDLNGIQQVTLYYRINDGTWLSTTMTLISGDTYGASIGPYAVGDIIEYYIVAIDDSPNHNSATDDNGGLYYSVEIIPTPTQINSLVYYIPVLAVLALAIVIRRKR